MKKKTKTVVLLLALALAAAVASQQFRYRATLKTVSSKYAEIQMGMTTDQVRAVFTGYDIFAPHSLEESNRPAHKVDADSLQLIRVKIRLWDDFIAIYYKSGVVVGKQMQSYDRYPQSAFPTVKQPPDHQNAMELQGR